jgi:AcrR family transcriptional regulator
MSRPRSTRAHRQVLDAALKLFSRQGIEATSVDSIAAASSVSKATIYKHWRDKDALCLEAVAYLHGLDEPPSATGDLRADLIAVLGGQPDAHNGGLQSRIMPHLMAYAAHNPAFSKAWRARAVQPIRLQLVQILKRSIADGSLAPGIDLELGVALLAGPMMYRKVLALIGRKPPQNLAQGVVDAFLRAHAPAAPRPRAGL